MSCGTFALKNTIPKVLANLDPRRDRTVFEPLLYSFSLPRPFVCIPFFDRGGGATKESPGLGVGRVRSPAWYSCFNNCFNAFCFNICFSFDSQQFSTIHSVVCNDSAIQSVFHTDFQPRPLFSSIISNSASTATRTTVSCLKSAHARLPLREPPGIGIDSV